MEVSLDSLYKHSWQANKKVKLQIVKNFNKKKEPGIVVDFQDQLP